MAEPGRAAKLSRLNSFRRECPFATQSAIEGLLANIKKHGVPELSTRKNMKEATRAHLNQHKAYGELLNQVPVVLHNGGTTDVWLVNGLTMLAAAYSQGGAWAAMLERVHGAHPSSPHSPWGLSLYCDEVMPGNSLAARQERKSWVVYGSFVELKECLSSEDAWLLLSVHRTSTVATIQSGIGQIMTKVLSQFFCNPICSPQNGVLLQHESDPSRNIRLYFGVSMFLQDGGAMKFCFNLKGDAGDKFCSLCCNCRAYNFEGMEEEMLGSDVCSLKELQLATDAEVLKAFQTCKEKKRTLSKSDFALWETATGITYNDYALFLNEELLALGLLQPVSQYCHDWMHALCSQGVMQVAIFRLLDTLSAWTRMESYFKLWQLPASMKKAGNLHSLFTVKRVASHREAEKFKCTASECLGVCPILAYMVSSVFLSEESHMPMCNAFLAMVGVLELLQAVPSGKVTPGILQQQVERALHLCRDADGAGKFIRKHHWMLHFSTALQRWNFLPSCWALERKHKVVARYATAATNLLSYEKGILEETLSHDLSCLHSTTSFLPGVRLVQPHTPSQKVHSFVCSCLQADVQKGAVLTSLVAKLQGGSSCQPKDFVLVRSNTAFPWEVVQVHIHFQVNDIVYTVVAGCPLVEYCANTCSALVNVKDDMQLLQTADILQPVVSASTQGGRRVLIPYQYRPSDGKKKFAKG